MNESAKSALAAELARFRAQIPPQTLTLADTAWTSYDTQEGAQSVLLLPSSGLSVEALFHYVHVLRPHYRVVALDVPHSVRTLEAAVLGIVGVLDALGVEKTHVVGFSWGALPVQMLLRGHAARVGDAVLGFGFVPNPERAAILKQQLGLMRIVPASIMLSLMRRNTRLAIANNSTQVNAADRAFWQEYYDAYYHQPAQRERMLAHARLSVAFATQTPFQTKDIAAWAGRMLLIESEVDEVIDEGERGAFKSMYPRAYVQTLNNCGHLAPILLSSILAQSVLKFLQTSDSMPKKAG